MSEAEDTLPMPGEEVVVLDGTGAQLSPTRAPGANLPAMQAAAAAAGGFVAGAAMVGLVGRRQRRSRALAKGKRGGVLRRGRNGRRSAAPAELLQIVGSRSLLLDVHLLGGSSAER